MNIAQSEKRTLFSLARGAIEYYDIYGKYPDLEQTNLPELLHQKLGVFVTLFLEGNLKGCIGRFSPELPLGKLVQKMAISAANNDSRFTPVTKDEIPKLNIEISILSPLQKIQTIDEIKIGTHGIYIVDGINRGTLLPQVATEQGWSAEQFVKYCAEKKAGLFGNYLQTAELYIYTSTIIKE